jgi:CHAD domain-containing protein
MKTGYEILKKQGKAINHYLVKSPDTFTSIDFHQLRLGIKKLNAFLDLVAFCSKDFNRKKILKPFTEIFRKAGKIRELQIEQLTIRKHNTKGFLKEYSTKLKLEISTEKSGFFILVNKLYPKIRKKQEELITYPIEINTKNCKEYFRKKSVNIEKIISKRRLKRKKLHQLRKQLKTFNYNLKALFSENKATKTPLKSGLTSLLGKWHDCEVLLQHLKKGIVKENLNYHEIQELKNLKTAVVSKRKQLLDKINTILLTQGFNLSLLQSRFDLSNKLEKP